MIPDAPTPGVPLDPRDFIELTAAERKQMDQLDSDTIAGLLTWDERQAKIEELLGHERATEYTAVAIEIGQQLSHRMMQQHKDEGK